ncbi:MAG: class I SAM-dependent methyltransferase [Oligoflexia bacterium]|nr:class I SAM-dependent methyltransferase [Oligoflexia bacterium]
MSSNDKHLELSDYKFENNDFLHYFKNLYKDRGLKAFYQFLNRPHRRSYSRSLIKKYAGEGYGLEIGCGARTIAPTERTVLSDAFSEHGVHGSIAKVFFKGDEIPYPDGTFDFLLNEHVLEHIANPIKALKEWLRVLKVGGHIFLFLPHKERTNDSLRKVTSLDHLIEDYQNDVPYNDPTHFDDWFQNVVEKGLMPEHYKHMEREELLNSASIHHHVWTEKEIVELFEYLDLEIVFVDGKVHYRRDTFLVVGKKKS